MLRNATYSVLGSHKATSPELCKAQTFLRPGGRPEEISNTRQGRADEPIKCNEKKTCVTEMPYDPQYLP